MSRTVVEKYSDFFIKNTESTPFTFQDDLNILTDMKGTRCLISLLLLISIIGAIALTASKYVDCNDPCADEFLDLALVCQNPILPVFAPQMNTHPYLPHSLKIFYFQGINYLTTVLRC
jgi:hypothetical protein